MKIAFIGFGEAARAFHDSLTVKDGAIGFSAHDVLFGREGAGGSCARAAEERGVAVEETVGGAVASADWIISAVTADQSLEAARSAAGHARQGQTYFDINSVSPGRKRESAGLLTQAGARYIDMAVMAPVKPRGHRTPVLLAGPLEPAALRRVEALEFDFDLVGPEAGAATAIKMVRSLFVKGLEAITVEAMLAASASGCLDHVLKSLEKSYPGLGWPGFAEYNIERMLKHGARRAAEMRESAATLDGLGLHGDLARAIAEAHDFMGALPERDISGEGFATGLSRLATGRQRRGR